QGCASAHRPRPAVESGESAYARNCLACHQADGTGVRGFQPPLVGSPWVRGDVPALATFVLTGGFDSGSRKEGANENVMPAFRELDDATLAAILTYVRQAFGEHAGPVSSEEVALARSHLPPAP
ncbi:MAG: c-type cytochrome, partial [Steroidobacterales bacterium]